MGLHYLTFMGRLFKNKKKLASVRITNSAGLHSENIVNSVSIFNDNYVINRMVWKYKWDE